MVTCIGTAIAGSSASQGQSATLSVTRDGYAYNSDQVQFAQVVDGQINQASSNGLKVVYDKNGNIKKVVAKLKEVQEVSSSSNDNDYNEIATSSEQGFSVSNTENGVDVNVKQLQKAAEKSGGEIKQKQVAVVKVKFKKNGEVKVTVKLKQNQKVT
jgi:valyl-tRNA synthetase